MITMVDDNISRISHELAKVEEGKLKAFADKDRVLIMIQDAPTELRRLAAALEKINVREIQALVAYKTPSKDEIPVPPPAAAAEPARPSEPKPSPEKKR